MGPLSSRKPKSVESNKHCNLIRGSHTIINVNANKRDFDSNRIFTLETFVMATVNYNKNAL